MAIALVGTPAQADNNGSDTTVFLANPGKAHTTGNLLVVLVGNETAGPVHVSGIADTAGNTYTYIAHAHGGNDSCEIWYAKNITGHAENVVTATFAATASYLRLTVFEFSGCDTTAPFTTGEYATGTGTGATPICGSAIATAVAASVIVAGCMHSASTAFTAGTDGQGHNFTEGPDSTYYATEYIIESATGSYTPDISAGSSGAYGIVAAAFKVAGSGAVSITPEPTEIAGTGSQPAPTISGSAIHAPNHVAQLAELVDPTLATTQNLGVGNYRSTTVLMNW